MAENKLYFTMPCEDGILKISFDAVASLVRDACLETKGVSEIAAAEAQAGEWIGYKGVVISRGEDDACCRIKLYITVLFGEVIANTANAVQEKVKNIVEASTSLKVEGVDVFVAGITFPKQ